MSELSEKFEDLIEKARIHIKDTPAFTTYSIDADRVCIENMDYDDIGMFAHQLATSATFKRLDFRPFMAITHKTFSLLSIESAKMAWITEEGKNLNVIESLAATTCLCYLAGSLQYAILGNGHYDTARLSKELIHSGEHYIKMASKNLDTILPLIIGRKAHGEKPKGCLVLFAPFLLPFMYFMI